MGDDTVSVRTPGRRRWWLRGLLAAPVAVLSLLVVQALMALSAEYLPTDPGYRIAAVVGPDGAVDPGGTAPDEAIRMVVLGDSTVAGVGAPDLATSLPVQIAARVAAEVGRPVAVTGLGVSGARLADVATDQADTLAAVDVHPDVVVAVVGSNDVTHATGPRTVRRRAAAVVDALDEAGDGAPVVVGGVPLFGGADALAQPLRWVVDRYASVVRANQRTGVLAAGGRHVEIARDASPRFAGVPDAMSSDGFHPAPTGYGFWADAIAPIAVEALGDR